MFNQIQNPLSSQSKVLYENLFGHISMPFMEPEGSFTLFTIAHHMHIP